MIDIEASTENEIRQYMTAQPITVAPMAPIGELAQKMVDAHIHRVLVVVDQNRPRGIVTSTDILAAVARAAQKAAVETERKPKKGPSPALILTRRSCRSESFPCLPLAFVALTPERFRHGTGRDRTPGPCPRRRAVQRQHILGPAWRAPPGRRPTVRRPRSAHRPDSSLASRSCIRVRRLRSKQGAAIEKNHQGRVLVAARVDRTLLLTRVVEEEDFGRSVAGTCSSGRFTFEEVHPIVRSIASCSASPSLSPLLPIRTLLSRVRTSGRCPLGPSHPIITSNPPSPAPNPASAWQLRRHSRGFDSA